MHKGVSAPWGFQPLGFQPPRGFCEHPMWTRAHVGLEQETNAISRGILSPSAWLRPDPGQNLPRKGSGMGSGTAAGRNASLVECQLRGDANPGFCAEHKPFLGQNINESDTARQHVSPHISALEAAAAPRGVMGCLGGTPGRDPIPREPHPRGISLRCPGAPWGLPARAPSALCRRRPSPGPKSRAQQGGSPAPSSAPLCAARLGDLLLASNPNLPFFSLK